MPPRRREEVAGVEATMVIALSFRQDHAGSRSAARLGYAPGLRAPAQHGERLRQLGILFVSTVQMPTHGLDQPLLCN